MSVPQPTVRELPKPIDLYAALNEAFMDASSSTKRGCADRFNRAPIRLWRSFRRRSKQRNIKVVVKTQHAKLAVVPLPYPIAMKLVGDRPQDEVDLQSLLMGEDLDYRGTRDIVTRFAGKFAAHCLDKAARIASREDSAYERSIPSGFRAIIRPS